MVTPSKCCIIYSDTATTPQPWAIAEVFGNLLVPLPPSLPPSLSPLLSPLLSPHFPTLLCKHWQIQLVYFNVRLSRLSQHQLADSPKHVFNTMIIYRDMGNSAHTHIYIHRGERERECTWYGGGGPRGWPPSNSGDRRAS